MHLRPLTPNVFSLYREIDSGYIDLDPEFQRGDVWNQKKQQVLIDTILREWQIPPIFFIRNEKAGTKEVLDGHQRLRSIQNFMIGKFPVNGNVQPNDDKIVNLHGLYFDQLPRDVRSNFENFPIQTFEIIDYKGSEPFELFYRLNQNSVLTSAERRNTLFGTARDQVKTLVEDMDELGFSSQTIGFNNARQSYDDVIARILMALDNKELSKKINDADITSKFRSDEGFSEGAVDAVRRVLNSLSHVIHKIPLKLNKPALTSLLIFLVTCIKLDEPRLADFVAVYKKFLLDYKVYKSSFEFPKDLFSQEYLNRISVSVNDGKALIFRQFFLCWLAHSNGIYIINHYYDERMKDTLSSITRRDEIDTTGMISEILRLRGWEVVVW